MIDNNILINTSIESLDEIKFDRDKIYFTEEINDLEDAYLLVLTIDNNELLFLSDIYLISHGQYLFHITTYNNNANDLLLENSSRVLKLLFDSFKGAEFALWVDFKKDISLKVISIQDIHNGEYYNLIDSYRPH